jgi:hypothetical protein
VPTSSSTSPRAAASFAGGSEIGLGAGLVDNKSAAIDDDWQAVRFVYRREDRPG